MVFTEPASLSTPVPQSDDGAVAVRSRSSLTEEVRAEELKLLMVSSSHSDRTEARVSSSAHESRCVSSYYLQSLFTFHCFNQHTCLLNIYIRLCLLSGEAAWRRVPLV